MKWRICCAAVMMWCVPFTILALNEVKGLRIWPSPESTRVVFDVNPGIKYTVYTMHTPDRVVIDFNDAQLMCQISKLSLKSTHIKQIRSGVHPQNMLRIVLELDQTMQVKPFILEATGRYGNRLVIDLESNDRAAILALFDLDHKQKVPKVKDFIIAIDPGHGGEDPGAIGPRGTREKDVVLAISKQLKDLINKQPGMQAFLIRNGDYYLGFRERMRRARSKHADLFISVHADSFINPRADGASVFILSSDKSSSVAARWLAASENRADLVGGVSLNDKSEMLATVLFDLTQAATSKASFDAADHILRSMGQSTVLHRNIVEKGGFLVLRSPDVPSLLVETGFLSNPKTEMKLRDKQYQQKIAKAISNGVRDYFKNKTRHVVTQ